MIFPVDVFQLKSVVTSADVAAERVHTLTKPRTLGLTRYTLIYIYTQKNTRVLHAVQTHTHYTHYNTQSFV